MELLKFITYLDYGVLGLSAIVLIQAFVLLAREQRRDSFRPEVELAIRKFMSLALIYALISLLATIIEGYLSQGV